MRTSGAAATGTPAGFLLSQRSWPMAIVLAGVYLGS